MLQTYPAVRGRCPPHPGPGHDQRDRQPIRRSLLETYAAPSEPLESLRRIRRDTWLLLAQLADLAPAEREPFRAGLQAVSAGMAQGLVLLDELPVSAAG